MRRIRSACCARAASGHAAARQRDELAPHHSITSSARARKVSGILKSIPLAALRLTISSNLVGCSHRQIGRFRTLEDFVDEDRRAAIEVGIAHAVCDQSASIDELSRAVDRWQPVLGR